MATTPVSASLKVALANTFVMYFKAHSYHWNVVGKNFNDHHAFFKTIYDELWLAVDAIAEKIRVADDFAPHSLEDLYSAKTIMEDAERVEHVEEMFSNLLTANQQIIDSLNILFKAATAENDQGLINFVAGRLDIHGKHAWMIRSLMKSGD